MEKFNFVGKNINAEEVKEATSYLKQQEEAFSGPSKFPEEHQKTEKENEMIQRVVDGVREELTALGLSAEFSVNPDSVHFLPGTRKSTSMHYTESDHIEIVRHSNPLIKLNTAIYNTLIQLSSKNAEKKTKELAALVHESIHAASHHKFELDIENKKLDTYRAGYRLSGDEKDYFRGFNEAVVEQTTKDILARMYKLKDGSFEKEFGKKLYNLSTGYLPEMVTVNSIVDKIAKMKGEEKEKIWERFKKGQFTGEMMHLRDVESVYGPGSLRILASMNTRKSNPAKKILYYTYFSTNNKYMKDSIARILLSKEKLTEKKYKKHIDIMNKEHHD